MLHNRLLALVTVTLAVAALIGGAALFQLPNSAPRQAVAQNGPAQTITVSGEGTIEAEPDMARLQLGVQTNATTAGEAQQRNGEQMAKVIDRLVAFGIDRKDIRTTSIGLYPTYDNQTGKSRTPSGYQASNQVNVTVRDLSKVAAVLDGAVAVGANSAGGVSFGILDDSALRQQAIAKAVEDARPKAEAVAKSMGVRIAGIQSVAEAGTTVPVLVEQSARSTASDASTPVMPGQLTVTGRVQVTFTF